MDLGLKGKVALVAGASQGMGRATASGFAREGAKVAICARGEAALNEAAAAIRKQTGGEVLAMVADMAKPEDIKKFVNRERRTLRPLRCHRQQRRRSASGRVHEIYRRGLAECIQSEFHEHHAHDPRSGAAYAQGRRRQGRSTLLLIQSRSRSPDWCCQMRCAARSSAWRRLFRASSARDNILFNNICPGRIDTDRAQKLNKARADRVGRPVEEINKEMAAEVPLGRYGTAEETADLIVFLGSDRASYITGTTMRSTAV